MVTLPSRRTHKTVVDLIKRFLLIANLLIIAAAKRTMDDRRMLDGRSMMESQIADFRSQIETGRLHARRSASFRLQLLVIPILAACNSERSEESLRPKIVAQVEIPRCARNDNPDAAS